MVFNKLKCTWQLGLLSINPLFWQWLLNNDSLKLHFMLFLEEAKGFLSNYFCLNWQALFHTGSIVSLFSSLVGNITFRLAFQVSAVSKVDLSICRETFTLFTFSDTVVQNILSMLKMALGSRKAAVAPISMSLSLIIFLLILPLEKSQRCFQIHFKYCDGLWCWNLWFRFWKIT